MTAALFTALVVLMAALAVAAIRRALPARGSPKSAAVVTGGLLLFYLAIPAALSGAGALDRYAPLPAPALGLVLALTVMTVVTGMSRVGARLASSVGTAGLVGFQAFRVPVEWLLHRLFTEGVIPVEMTYSGRNFDILSGLTAVGLGFWIAKGGKVPRPWLIAWNVGGLALLANIVAVAVLCTPVPFRYFSDGPPNLLPSTFPYVWLPTFLVQAALFGHLLIFRTTRRQTASVQ